MSAILPVLEDINLLQKVINASDVILEYPETLYNYFLVNGKENELITYVTQLEKETKEGSNFLRSDSLLSGLLGSIFLSNIGITYLNKILTPCFEELARFSKPNSDDICKAVSLLLDKMIEFPALCPIQVRKAFLLSREALKIDIGEESAIEYISSLLFLRFIGPALMNPSEYELQYKTNTEWSQRENLYKPFIDATRMLQKIANNTAFECGIKEEECKRLHDLCLSITLAFTDKEKIEFAEESILASLGKQNYSKEQKIQAEKEFNELLEKIADSESSRHLEIEIKCYEHKKLLNSFDKVQWKLMKEKKRLGISVSIDPAQSQHKGLYTWLIEYTINAPISLIVNELDNNFEEYEYAVMPMCAKVDTYNFVENGTTRDYLFYFLSKLPSPFKDREFLTFNRRDFDGKKCVVTGFSTQHEKYPITKKYVRGIVHKTLTVLEEIDQQRTSFRSCFLTDLGGRFPPWLANKFVGTFAKNAENVKKYFETMHSKNLTNASLKIVKQVKKDIKNNRSHSHSKSSNSNASASNEDDKQSKDVKDKQSKDIKVKKTKKASKTKTNKAAAKE